MDTNNYYTDWLTPSRVALELSIDPDKVREWAKRNRDPLPVKLPDGNVKQWRVNRSTLNKWLERNWRDL